MALWSPIQLAATGARMLDAVVPGWHNLIDTERLDVSSLCDCGVAQIYENNYQFGAAELKLSDDEQVANGVWVNEADADLRRSRYRCLTRAWKMEINRRRSADNDNPVSEQNKLPFAA